MGSEILYNRYVSNENRFSLLFIFLPHSMVLPY